MPTVYNTLYTFLPLPHSQRNRAIDRELLVDNSRGRLFMNVEDFRVIDLTISNIQKEVDSIGRSLIEDVDLERINLRLLYRELNNLNEWILTIDNPTDSLLQYVKDKINEMGGMFNGLASIINSKVDKIEGKRLTLRDYTDSLKNKLDSIDEEANRYFHPNRKQCDFIPAVSSINGKIGAVTLNTEDIGMATVHPRANKYVHPKDKQCTSPVVTSVNNKRARVILSKEDIGLTHVKNLPIGSIDMITGKIEPGYCTPKLVGEIFGRFIKRKFRKAIHLPDGTHLGIDEDFNLIYATLSSSHNVSQIYGLHDIVDFYMSNNQTCIVLDTHGYIFIFRFKNNRIERTPINDNIMDTIGLVEALGCLDSDIFAVINKESEVFLFIGDRILEVEGKIYSGNRYHKAVKVSGYGNMVCILYENAELRFYINSLDPYTQYIGNRAIIEGVMDMVCSREYVLYIDINSMARNNSTTILDSISRARHISCSRNTASVVTMDGMLFIHGKDNIYSITDGFANAFCFNNSITARTTSGLNITL